MIQFRRTSQPRPFVAQAWRHEEPGGKGVPELRFALALVDPL